MEGGAFQSEVFDNGQEFRKPRRPRVQGASPGMQAGTPPAMYNPAPVDTDSRAFGILVISLRSALVLVTLVAFGVMAATIFGVYRKSTSYYDSSSYSRGRSAADSDARSSAVKVCVGIMSVDIIVGAYAIVQVVLSLVKVSTTGAFISPTRGRNLITFVCDLVLSYALIATAGAAAVTQPLLREVGSCDSNRGFCKMATASIAMSFVAFAVLALLTALYLVRLLRMSK